MVCYLQKVEPSFWSSQIRVIFFWNKLNQIQKLLNFIFERHIEKESLKHFPDKTDILKE